MSVKKIKMHIGAHDIFPNLLENVANSPLSNMIHGGFHVKTLSLKALIKPNKTRKIIEHATVLEGLERSVPEDCDFIFLSDHGILCPRNEVVSGEGMYAASLPMIERLHAFSRGYEPEVHICIMPQHDYPLAKNSMGTNVAALSWVPLIAHVAHLFKGCAVKVWSVENFNESAVGFVSDICGIELGETEIDVLYPWIERDQMRLRKEYGPDLIYDDRALSLDLQYERDVNDIIKIPNVELLCK